MSTPGLTRGATEGRRLDPLVLSAAAVLGLLCLLMALAGNGHVGVALAPLALALVAFAAARLPLRDTLPALAFLCLTLENPAEAPASGAWRSPLYPVGSLFLAHMNVTIPMKALVFSGLVLALVFLVGVWVVRRATHSPIDRRDWVPAASPLRTAALVCIAAILVVWGFGLVRGGNFGASLWQIFRVVYLPVVVLLYAAGLRGPSDAPRLGTVLILAALVRALLAIYVRLQFPDTQAVPHATAHADSMLFADAFLLVLVIFFERPSPKTLRLCLGVLPVLAWGMVSNNRRLVWVELGLGLLVLALISPWTRLKRKVAQILIMSQPLILVYVGVGWNHPTGVFAPVRTVRSVVDSQADGSTAWRDWENYNLYSTLKGNPFLGTGFGHEYTEVIQLPDISGAYALYRYAPHNSVLGLLAYSGFLGFAGIWMIIPLGVFFAVRSYRFSRSPRDRITALATVGVLVGYMVHCYGDMGLGTWTSVFTVAPALALVAKLAVANGAWPGQGTRPGWAPVAQSAP